MRLYVMATRSFIVYPGTETYPLGHGVVATPLPKLMKQLLARDQAYRLAPAKRA